MANGLPTRQSGMTCVCTALCAVGWVGLAVGTRKTTQTTLCFGEEKGEGRGEGDHIFHHPHSTHTCFSVFYTNKQKRIQQICSKARHAPEHSRASSLFLFIASDIVGFSEEEKGKWGKKERKGKKKRKRKHTAAGRMVSTGRNKLYVPNVESRSYYVWYEQ